MMTLGKTATLVAVVSMTYGCSGHRAATETEAKLSQPRASTVCQALMATPEFVKLNIGALTSRLDGSNGCAIMSSPYNTVVALATDPATQTQSHFLEEVRLGGTAQVEWVGKAAIVRMSPSSPPSGIGHGRARECNCPGARPHIRRLRKTTSYRAYRLVRLGRAFLLDQPEQGRAMEGHRVESFH
jgi:hypothetical protein